MCATVFPLCTPDVARPVAACRSLCHTVQSACQSTASWPAFIDCDTLPQPERHELCMQVPHNEAAAGRTPTPVSEPTGDANPTAPSEPQVDTTPPPAIITSDAQPSSVQSDILILTNLPAGPSIWPWLSHSVHHPAGHAAGRVGPAALIPAVMSPVICAANFTPISAHRCGPQPGTDALFTPQQKRIAGTWTLALAALCFILTLFSLVTFWAEPMRFGYPERPVLFLALCYNLLSVAYLERAIFHQQLSVPTATAAASAAAAAAATQTSSAAGGGGSAAAALLGGVAGSGAVVGGGSGGLTCPASFLLVGYLQLAAAAWWFLFAVCWYLSTVRQWSPEALERRATLLHVLAWCPAAVPPVAAVLWDAVRPLELTGMCAARGFVEVPAAGLLVAGGVCIWAASRSLGGMRRRRRRQTVAAVVAASDGGGADDGLEAEEDAAAFVFQQRLAQIRQRICVFSAVFFVPALAAVGLGFVETGYVSIAACVLGDPCVAPKRWPMWPTLLRLFVTLAGGSLAGMWVWSKKTCESYRTRMLVQGQGQGLGGWRGGHQQQHHQQQQLLQQRQHLAAAAAGPGAYLVAQNGGVQAAGRKYPLKKAPATVHASVTTTAAVATTAMTPSRSTVGPLYAGISFHNVPVYSVRAPPAPATASGR